MKKTREEMLECLLATKFAAHELNLYLDTHPCDTEAMELLHEYVHSLEALTAEYEQCFGPLKALSHMDDRTHWQWINSPWPWEI